MWQHAHVQHYTTIPPYVEQPCHSQWHGGLQACFTLTRQRTSISPVQVRIHLKDCAKQSSQQLAWDSNIVVVALSTCACVRTRGSPRPATSIRWCHFCGSARRRGYCHSALDASRPRGESTNRATVAACWHHRLSGLMSSNLRASYRLNANIVDMWCIVHAPATSKCWSPSFLSCSASPQSCRAWPRFYSA